MTTYRARCGALIVRDVTPGEFRDELTLELESE